MDTNPRVVDTALGPIELRELGEGPAVIVSHGTMGGWDQSEILARTLTEPGCARAVRAIAGTTDAGVHYWY